MTQPGRITGVYVTAFEERSFFPGATTIPDRNHPQRYGVEIELNPEQLARFMADVPTGRGLPGADAYALTFIGRRTRYPYMIGCDGSHAHVYVPDRLLSARFLGEMEHSDLPPRPSERPPWKPFKRSGEGGEIARQEEEALARCAG